MSVPKGAVGVIRFDRRGPVEAVLSGSPPRWGVRYGAPEYLPAEDAEAFRASVEDTLNTLFDPATHYRGPSDGVPGCRTVAEAARFYGGAYEQVPRPPGEPDTVY